MHKIWLGIAFAALIAGSASAQDHSKYLNECAREAGLYPDHAQKLQSGSTLSTYYIQHESQVASINDCVARKASLARNPSASRKPRTPQ